jgi:dimethylamine monooxygenase subunit C
MLASTMKSRPVYSKLSVQHGTRHVMVADASGAEAILRLAAGAPDSILGLATFLQIRGDVVATETTKRLEALRPHMLCFPASIAAAAPVLAQILSTANMGTRLYLAGTEGLIGKAMKTALEAGMEPAAIQAEHVGSCARRVQCVHCKGITEDVRTQPVVCAHCGLNLFVRDHYSRRIAAFQGVCIDAEEPGVVPEAQERFK